MTSPAFSTFRELMDIWDENINAERKEKLKQAMEGELSFFFKFKDEIFGCPEESRLVFAKLKTPDEDVTPAWATEAGFLGINLSRALEEEQFPRRLFYKKDLNGIKIIDREVAEKELI